MSQKYPFDAVQGSDKAINVPFLARELGPGPVYCSGHVARPSPRHTGLDVARSSHIQHGLDRALCSSFGLEKFPFIS